ncbi:MAG: hypothetical protein WDM91_06750 [Rhizomicrobium sp.]
MTDTFATTGAATVHGWLAFCEAARAARADDAPDASDPVRSAPQTQKDEGDADHRRF